MRRLNRGRSRKAGLAPGTLLHTGNGEPSGRPGVHVIDYDGEAVRELGNATLAQCRALIESPSVTWIDVAGVHDLDQLREFGAALGLHPLVLEDIANTEQRPKLEDYGDYLYLVLKMLSPGPEDVVVEQVSLILGPRFVVSFQEAGKPGDVFDGLRTRLRQNAGPARGRGADFLAYSLIDAIVDHYFVVLERLSERIERFEEELLAGPPADIVRRIHALRSEMIFLRRSVWPLREVLSALERGETRLMQPSTLLYLRDAYDHTVHVIDTLETLRDMVAAMLDLYLSSMTYRMNEVMKVLTMIATIFIPLSFIVGVYGMNFAWMPELEQRWAYPLLWAFMVSVAVGMVVYFRRKGWI